LSHDISPLLENPVPVGAQGRVKMELLFDRILESMEFFGGGHFEPTAESHNVPGGIIIQFNQVIAVGTDRIGCASAH
jgi:hypothetical protein